jgi:hypothetical protein
MHELRDISISFALVFKDNPPRYEKDLYLPSIKLDDSFHVNMKTFDISMTQSHFHRNGSTSTEGMVMQESDIVFSPSG